MIVHSVSYDTISHSQTNRFHLLVLIPPTGTVEKDSLNGVHKEDKGQPGEPIESLLPLRTTGSSRHSPLDSVGRIVGFWRTGDVVPVVNDNVVVDGDLHLTRDRNGRVRLDNGSVVERIL